MRFYRIEIEGGPTWTSMLAGRADPAALNVEFDIPVAPDATPMGGAFVRIWGVPVSQIGSQSDLINKNIKVYGGMSAGLPLANPAQQGLLVQGFIFQAFANWVGTDQTLDLVVLAGQAPSEGQSASSPKNIVLNWRKGDKLGDAIKTALSTAFPGYTVNVNVSDKLVFSEDQQGYYLNRTEFATFIKQLSRAIVGGDYAGVEIALREKTFTVFDGNVQQNSGVKQLGFADIIGQPTWIDAPFIQLKCVMRGDLAVGGQIVLPPTLVVTTARSMSSLLNQRLTFGGTFQIGPMRHIGNFRQADASSWVTVIDAFPTQQA